MKVFKYIITFIIVIIFIFTSGFFLVLEKEDISKYIYNKTKKEIHFDKYEISFYPKLILKLSKVKYEDENIKISIHKLLVQLFFDEEYSVENLKIKSLYLVDPEITIYKNEQMNQDKQINEIIDIEELYLKNAKISYAKYSIKNITLNASLKKSIANIKYLNIKQFKGIENIDITGLVDLNKKNSYFDMRLISKNLNIQTLANILSLEIPKLKDVKSLKDISVSLKIKGDKNKLYIKESQASFDDTTVDFKAIVKDLNPKTMVTILDINQLDLNKYIDFTQTQETQNNTMNEYFKFVNNIQHISSVKIKELKMKDFILSDVFFKIKVKDNLIDINPITLNLFGGKLSGAYTIDAKGNKPKIQIKQQINNLELSYLFDKKEKILTGTANLLTNITFEGLRKEEVIQSIKGSKMLYGHNLIYHQYDIDDILSQYEKTKQIDFFDIGAVLLAGPFAGLFTQSVKIAMLKHAVDKKGNTQIKEFSSLWKIENSKAIAKDVAVKTEENIIALKGEINLYSKEFRDIQIAALDKKGCAKYIQILSGSFKTSSINTNENTSEIFLSPITSIIKGASELFEDCKKFYKGRVK